jgi:hypothetical protein
LGYNTYIHGNVTRKLPCGYLRQKKNVFFFHFSSIKSGNRRAEHVLGLWQWLVTVGEEKGGERVWEGEYGSSTVYTCK